MIKAQNTGIRITLTKEDIKESSKNKNMDLTLDDFNLSHEEIFSADRIDFTMTSNEGLMLWGKKLKDRHSDALKPLYDKSKKAYKELLTKEEKKVNKWWEFWKVK